MNSQEFMTSESVQTWLTGLKSNTDLHSTKYHWVENLKRFCEWMGKSPDELINERKQELKSEDQRRITRKNES